MMPFYSVPTASHRLMFLFCASTPYPVWQPFYILRCLQTISPDVRDDMTRTHLIHACFDLATILLSKDLCILALFPFYVSLKS